MGIPAGYTVMGLDMRPATAELWALACQGSNCSVFTLNGNILNFRAVVDCDISANPSIDFNPVADRLRIVTRKI